MKYYRKKKRVSRKRGGQSVEKEDENTKPNYYNQKLNLMEEGKLNTWKTNPIKPTIKSTSNPSMSQLLRKQYDLQKKDEKDHTEREKQGLTFGGKTKRRRRRRRTKKRSRRNYRR